MTGESESVSREKSKELLVSVIIPVYQVSDYVERCLLSMMNQTYTYIECIIVDDCSPDDSIARCERLIEGYQGSIKFRILHHEHNRGLSAARNTGTNAATGEYIFYLDSDDELTIDCLEKLTQPVFKDASIEMVLGYYEYITDEVSKENDKQKSIREEDIDSLEAIRDYYYTRKGWFPLTAWNKLIRKDFLVNNQLRFIEGILFEDHPWTFYVIKYLKHLYIIPAVTYLYYRRPNSISTGISREDATQHFGVVYDEIASHFTSGEEGREAAFFIGRFCYNYLNYPELSPYKSIAVRFKKALQDGHHQKELIYLILTEYASKTSFGRFLFPRALKVRVIILSPFHRLKHIINERKGDKSH